MSPLKAIRFQLNEIRLCEAVTRALGPLQGGRHPWWGEGEKNCQTLADSERQAAFRAVPGAVATLIRSDASVVAVDDALFADLPGQSWRLK